MVRSEASSKTGGCSESIRLEPEGHESCEAIPYADPASEAFVFIDSDSRPPKEWLRHLVAPLEDPSIGAATGYRWFISRNETFASEMRNMWNASIASALGPNRKTNFCWGGATAIRREVFERLDIREKWRGTLSDDFTLTRAIKDEGLEIHFVPRGVDAVGRGLFRA